jgi:hypothetical protein
MPEGEEGLVKEGEVGGGGGEGKGETVLARKLRQTLSLKLENDRDTIQALEELSTFFHVSLIFVRLRRYFYTISNYLPCLYSVFFVLFISYTFCCSFMLVGLIFEDKNI